IGSVVQECVKIFARSKRPLRHRTRVRAMLDRPFVWKRVHRAIIRRAANRLKLGASRFEARRYNKYRPIAVKRILGVHAASHPGTRSPSPSARKRWTRKFIENTRRTAAATLDKTPRRE